METIDTYDMYKQSLTHSHTMIKATASWCSPCKKVQPQVLELISNEEYKDIHFYEYDIDEIDDCPLQEFIRVVPTFLFFERDQLVHRVKGTDILAVEDYLNKMVNNMRSTNLEGQVNKDLIENEVVENEEVENEKVGNEEIENEEVEN